MSRRIQVPRGWGAQSLQRAALYARVSTEEQADRGYSLPAQLQRLRQYCEARDLKQVREYVDDGYSGRGINRPQYTRMFQELDDWDVLVVMKMDRIHRNSRNFMEMMDTLAKQDRKFISITESFDTTTAMGRFVLDMIQRIAQLESEVIGERVKMGMLQKAKMNLETPAKSSPLGFNHPYGYDYDRKEKKLIVVDGEAKGVGYIFRKYLDGYGVTAIASDLNKNPRFPSKRGGGWHPQTVSQILRNPIYCGKMRWACRVGDEVQGVEWEAAHSPIIPRDTFERVQEEWGRRSRSQQVKKRKKVSVHGQRQIPEQPTALEADLRSPEEEVPETG